MSERHTIKKRNKALVIVGVIIFSMGVFDLLFGSLPYVYFAMYGAVDGTVEDVTEKAIVKLIASIVWIMLGWWFIKGRIYRGKHTE